MDAKTARREKNKNSDTYKKNQDVDQLPHGFQKFQHEGFGHYFPHILRNVSPTHPLYSKVLSFARVLSRNPSWKYYQKEQFMIHFVRGLIDPEAVIASTQQPTEQKAIKSTKIQVIEPGDMDIEEQLVDEFEDVRVRNTAKTK